MVIKSRLYRLSLFLAIAAAIAGSGYFFRELMGSTVRYHSASHYLLRFSISAAVLVALILTVLTLSESSPTENLSNVPPPKPGFKWSNALKRFVDVTVSMVLLTALFPLLCLVAALVFVLEGYPVFYISKRYISRDQCVTVLKFRTMVKDAISPRYRLRERFMRDGFLDIPLDCEVYTPIGRLLERSQMVETLQLFNVLFHGMSLIGNRPLPKDNILLLRQFEGWERRFDSPAGLTGISQVVGKLNQNAVERLEIESMYSSLYRSSGANILRCDLPIIYYTVRLLLLKRPLAIQDAKRIIHAASGTR
jgi:lipopolysaccharide/colanic/teichoic acid biosynthesis glycosyltransferase